LLSIAAILVLAGPAQAQSLPRYDVDRYCQQVSNVSGGSVMIFNRHDAGTAQ
jgi:hypothetical protein